MGLSCTELLSDLSLSKKGKKWIWARNKEQLEEENCTKTKNV